MDKIKDQIYDIPDFENVFPNVISQLQQILKKTSYFQKITGKYIPEFEKTCNQIKKIIKQWEWLQQQSNKKVVYHVYKMIYSLVNDKEFTKLNSKDQSILLWASLLHDICKLGLPSIDGKDHCHPFKSGYEVLKIFHELNYINLTDIQLQEWDLIFQNAYLPCQQEKGKFIHNNTIAIQMKSFLDKIYGDHEINPQKEIILLVFLHQSLHLIKQYPPITPLENNCYSQLLNERFLDLMHFIQVHDSNSYLIFKPIKLFVPKLKTIQDEVRKNINNIKQLINEQNKQNNNLPKL